MYVFREEIHEQMNCGQLQVAETVRNEKVREERQREIYTLTHTLT